LFSAPNAGRGVSARTGHEENKGIKTVIAILRRIRTLLIAEQKEAVWSIGNRTHADCSILQMNRATFAAEQPLPGIRYFILFLGWDVCAKSLPEGGEKWNRTDNDKRNGDASKPFGSVSTGVPGPGTQGAWDGSCEKQDRGSESPDHGHSMGLLRIDESPEKRN